LTVEPLRILIADDESIIRLDLKGMLKQMGHDVVAEAGDGVKALQLARNLRPDLCILDIKMPEMDGIDAAKKITEEAIAPVLLVTAYSQVELVERAQEAGVYAYVVKPFKETDLQPSISIAISRFREYQELLKEKNDLNEALETRKLVERAKGILMVKQKLAEPEAFRKIQQQSMNTRRSMKEIAEAIIIANDL
jgi:two-component system, response regulator PdtaR